MVKKSIIILSRQVTSNLLFKKQILAGLTSSAGTNQASPLLGWMLVSFLSPSQNTSVISFETWKVSFDLCLQNCPQAALAPLLFTRVTELESIVKGSSSPNSWHTGRRNGKGKNGIHYHFECLRSVTRPHLIFNYFFSFFSYQPPVAPLSPFPALPPPSSCPLHS